MVDLAPLQVGGRQGQDGDREEQEESLEEEAEAVPSDRVVEEAWARPCRRQGGHAEAQGNEETRAGDPGEHDLPTLRHEGVSQHQHEERRGRDVKGE